jgi:hypothetical protein
LPLALAWLPTWGARWKTSRDDVAAQAAELAALPVTQAAFWIVVHGGQPVGVVGCEFEPALRRAAALG